MDKIRFDFLIRERIINEIKKNYIYKNENDLYYIVEEIEKHIYLHINYNKSNDNLNIEYEILHNIKKYVDYYYFNTNDDKPKIIPIEEIIDSSKKVFFCRKIKEEFLGEEVITIEKQPYMTFLYNEECDIAFEVRKSEYQTYYKKLDKEKKKILKNKMVDKGSHYEVIL